MNNKEQEIAEKNSKKQGDRIPNRQSRNFPGCDSNRKWIFEANQTNNNPKNHKIKNHGINDLLEQILIETSNRDSKVLSGLKSCVSGGRHNQE